MLEHHEDALTLLRNQTSYNLLGNILSRIVQEFLELEAGEAIDDLILAPDRLRVLLLELVKLTFLLIHVLN